MKVIAVVFFTLFSVGVFASNQAFDEFKKKIEGQKSPQQRSELLVIANELLASESLDELQTAFVLHRAGLICIREACFDKTEQ